MEIQTLANTPLQLGLLDCIPLGAFLLDEHYRVAGWNRIMESWTKFPFSELAGRDLRIMFPRVDHPKFTSRIDQVLQGGPPAIFSAQLHQYLIPCPLPNGQFRLQHTTVSAIRTGPSGTIYALFTLQDVTEIHQQLREYRQMRDQAMKEVLERRQAEEALRASEERYRELSIRDGLTNLFNSRYFHQQLEMEMGRANRYLRPLAIIMMDIDNFKSYNDTYGHQEGDQALCHLARVLTGSIRGADSAFRFGGEEFTVILPETTKAEAVVVAERIRSNFARLPLFPLPAVEVCKTVSIGVSGYRPGEKLADFLRRADERMYHAKLSGKNRICDGSFPGKAQA